MTFTNIQVSLDDLPSVDEVRFTDLKASYARLQLFVALGIEAIVLVSILLIALFAPRPADDGEMPVLIMVIAAVLLIVFPVYRFAAARAKGYAVREHDVILRSGLFFQKETVQPIRRIQHIELTRGPLEKRLSLANLKLFSAGSGRATFTIPGLSLRSAARTRRYILTQERS
ncbi:MAG: PH domain-containing protein [Proteobacteria bacterium]|nr:PH domain-containing protein [Pseudomonadota bacterium]